MRPHPDFAAAAPPREAAFGRFRLSPLGPADLDEDFAAVTQSAEVLSGLFPGWPDGLTRAENALDLAWHAREFDLTRSFAWVLRDAEGAYLGCVYLFPEPGRRGAAEAVHWLREMPGRTALQDDLRPLLEVWMAHVLPPGIAPTWRWR